MTSDYGDLRIWIIILVLGVGTFLLRWSFLGGLGNRQIPEWALRMLRYTPVAVLPALVAPLVTWPAATGARPIPRGFWPPRRRWLSVSSAAVSSPRSLPGRRRWR